MAANSWRTSIWSKFLAGGFIILIGLGNIWFIESFKGQGAHVWLQWAFLLTSAWIFVNGCGLTLHYILHRKEAEHGESDTPL